MSNVVTRALSGAVYVALIVGAILWGEVPFMVLTSVFAVWGVAEFTNITHGEGAGDTGGPRATVIDIIGALLIIIVPTLSFAHALALPSALTVLAAYVLARAICSLYDTRAHAYREVAKSVLGVVYIALPLLMLNMLYINNAAETRLIVLMVFVMIWLNDTGAFCFGSMLGKNRLFPRLSPKKSWEGFFGGMLCTVACGVCCGLWADTPNFGMGSWVVMSLLVCVFSTWGDLFESMLKRTVGVKDSGSLIPGHGGILDRIDSLLFVSPVAYMVYFFTLLLA